MFEFPLQRFLAYKLCLKHLFNKPNKALKQITKKVIYIVIKEMRNTHQSEIVISYNSTLRKVKFVFK